MGGSVADDADAVQQLGRPWWQELLGLKAPENIDLVLVGGRVHAVVRRHPLGHHLTKLPQLQQAGVGIVEKKPLRQRAELAKQRLTWF
jgi:hypothetical protein